MTLEKIREELEGELTWRQNELRFLKNQMATMLKEDEREKYRKSLIVMLYAHFEGFSKTALLIYIKFINDLKLNRHDVNENLQASSMNQIFRQYEDTNRKCDIFRKELPDDKILHNFFRRTDLLIQLKDFLSEELIVKDEVIDTESNLKYKILQKNFYKLGLPHNEFEIYSRDVDDLVNLRNSIAHGSEKTGIIARKYDVYERKIFFIMDELMKILIKNLKDESYKI